MFEAQYEVAKKVNNDYLFIIYGKLEQIGKQKPYFSVTHEKWRATRKGERDKRCKNPVLCGARGRETERKFPEFADLFDFHLRDVDGKPMHEIANGVYFIEHNEKEALANHLMISVDEAEKLIALCKGASREGIEGELSMYIHENNLHEVWKAKADNLVSKYNLKVHYERW